MSTEKDRSSDSRGNGVAPYSAGQLETLLARIDVLPEESHNKVLLRILESIISEVEFDNVNFHDIYVYFVQRLPITSQKVRVDS